MGKGGITDNLLKTLSEALEARELIKIGVLDNAEMANNIYPSDERRIELREAHLLEARAALMALDVHLAHCYDVMMLNPEGCFQTKSGKPVEKYNATRRLEGMAQTLGELIDKEAALLSGVIKQCKKSA